ncbi:Esterase/lipase [Fontimonas thermophila]|uniref:Esterase/lipase n=1 Tax=Fontimonas thermophila TaxID=1076937 RepID=A0A1I2IWV2_9GAMM|nr:alpha/beta hydrolase [Fontimonas thermophila]SFF46885.1 Esterase/lipase [Fontimonas thermophila]
MTFPVVLIHGMWCTGANWQRVRELIEPRGYRCFAPTLPAHMPVPDQPLQVARISLREYVDALYEEVMRQHYDLPPILIGHSMGALLAQQLAARVPPLALVLLTPAPPWGVNGLRGSNVVAFAPWLMSGRFWRNAYKPSLERASTSLFNGVPVDRHRTLYETLVHESGRATAEIALWWADLARAAAVHSDEVRCPVYVVSCGQDRLTPAAVVRAAVARYPQAAHRYYPARGHWVIDDEETEEMMHAICGWLRPIEQRYVSCPG